MSKQNTILFDLDGTLTDTMHNFFTPFRDGISSLPLSEVPVFEGALDLVKKVKQDGHQVFIVSDSHPRFVLPIAKDIFGVDALSLAYKPTTEKIQEFVQNNAVFKLPSSRIFFVGDTALDVLVARKLRIPSVHLMHPQDYKPEIWTEAQKFGPTYSCRSYKDIYAVISNPLENLLVLEGLKFGGNSQGVIKIDEVDYLSSAGRKRYQVALARQESGLCDIFAMEDWYRTFGSVHRSDDFLKRIAIGVTNYINFFLQNKQVQFEILTFVPDKATTVPSNKMQHFAKLIETGLPCEPVLKWSDEVQGSIRNNPHKKERYGFVRRFMRKIDKVDLSGKSVIVIDDQLTTGATMNAVTDILWENQAKDILFISLFRMISEVSSGKTCPKCGKELSIKSRKTDGNRFYSCTPNKYGGVGCGHIENFK